MPDAKPSAARTWRRPVSVLILVYSRDGEVLLLQRRRPHAFWQSVTGSLEPRETHGAAARRELREETGFSDPQRLTFSGRERVFEIDPRWRDRYAPGVRHNTEYEWRYVLDKACAVRLDADEHAGYCWMPIGDAIEAVWSWTNREALLALQDAL